MHNCKALSQFQFNWNGLAVTSLAADNIIAFICTQVNGTDYDYWLVYFVLYFMYVGKNWGAQRKNCHILYIQARFTSNIFIPFRTIFCTFQKFQSVSSWLFHPPSSPELIKVFKTCRPLANFFNSFWFILWFDNLPQNINFLLWLNNRKRFELWSKLGGYYFHSIFLGL